VHKVIHLVIDIFEKGKQDRVEKEGNGPNGAGTEQKGIFQQ